MFVANSANLCILNFALVPVSAIHILGPTPSGQGPMWPHPIDAKQMYQVMPRMSDTIVIRADFMKDCI